VIIRSKVILWKLQKYQKTIVAEKIQKLLIKKVTLEAKWVQLAIMINRRLNSLKK